MKQTILAMLVGYSVFSNPVYAVDDNNLEPCINGEVSATGLFETQEAEDRYFRNKFLRKKLAAEPCISGSYSEYGLLDSREDKGPRTRRQ